MKKVLEKDLGWNEVLFTDGHGIALESKNSA
jgi:hypothetical protein